MQAEFPFLHSQKWPKAKKKSPEALTPFHTPLVAGGTVFLLMI
jgi:hypothetical protein